MRYLTDKNIMTSLRCPLCKSAMTVETEHSASLCCVGQKKHCYDFSSRGYVNFAPPGHSTSGDSKKAVAARSDFLDLQLYRPVAEALRDIVKKHCKAESGLLVDAGCGEGYYSMILAEGGYSVFGVDLSKFAVDTACKRANVASCSNSFFAVCSVFELPLADNSADALVNIFAPCAEDEYIRVLKDGGVAVIVYAGPDHLLGLKRAIYDIPHGNDGREDLPRNIDLVEEKRLTFEIELNTNADIKNLFAMTPYYWKTSKKDFEKLETLSYLKTEIDIIIAVYKK